MQLEPIAAHRIAYSAECILHSFNSLGCVACLLAPMRVCPPSFTDHYAEEDDEDDDLPVSLAL
jgi:hypothetical protein